MRVSVTNHALIYTSFLTLTLLDVRRRQVQRLQLKRALGAMKARSAVVAAKSNALKDANEVLRAQALASKDAKDHITALRQGFDALSRDFGKLGESITASMNTSYKGELILHLERMTLHSAASRMSLDR